MIKIAKRAVALFIVAAMTMTLFVGCSKGKNGALDSKETAMVVGETKVPVTVANFFLRYNQSLMESMYTQYMGENVWNTALSADDDTTYGENLKETLIEDLKAMYIIVNHAEDYKVSLTEEEVAAIEKAADEFLKENASKDVQAKVSGDKETVVAYLTLYTMAEKMGEAMRADIDTNVTDEEAAQKKARYVVYKTVNELEDGTTEELSKDEVAAQKKAAEDFLAGAKANGSMEAYATEKSVSSSTVTFNAESTALDAAVIKAADALAVNGFSEVIEAEDGYYVLQLESEFDQTATDAAKETILEERKEARYEELVEKWTKDTKVTVNQKVWDKLDVHGLKVNYLYDETEE